MRRFSVGPAILVVLAAVVPGMSAFAQGPGLERVIPDSFLWQPHPDGITIDPKMASIVSYQIHVPLWQSPLDPRIPEEAAQLFMAKIRAELTAQRLHAGNISVFLHGFGHDWSLSDLHAPANERWEQSNRFFCEDDRLPGIDDSSDFPISYPNDGDHSARAYRHAFLWNATSSGPLAQWMESFCAYIAEHYDDAEYALPHPGTWKWWFDSEVWIATWYGGPNPVYMLSQLASRPNIWGTASESNRGWPVPGSTGWTTPTDWPRTGTDRNWNAQMPASADGLSYYEMYEAVRADQLAAGVDQWPPDIRDLTYGLLAGARADDDRNRKFLIWFLQTTYAAQDAAFAASAYDVIRSHFGQNTVCSNYEYADYDGVEDWTGWYLDLANANQPSNRFPRVWLDRSASFALMAKDNVLGPTVHDRWVGTRQKNSASMNSPVLYPLQYLQLAGHPGLPQQKSHSQANLYLPTTLSCYTCNSDCDYVYNPDPAGDQCEGTCITHAYRIEETDAWTCQLAGCGRCGWDNSLRLDRLAIESIINSHGGMHFDTLAPWLVQLILGDVDPFSYYDNEDPFRATLAMLRAKNVPVLIFWTGGQTGSPTLNAWQTTKSLIRRVYAAEVFGIKSVYGDVPDGFDSHEKTMLEYTLRDATGAEYVSSVRGEFSYNEVDNIWEMLAGIEVYFDVRLKDNDDAFVDLASGDFKYEINVESVGDSENLGIIERVLVWDYLGEEWVYVPTREGELSHGFNTPDGTSRRTLMLPYASARRYAELAEEPVPGNPNETRPVNRMKIRVVHKGPMANGQWPGWHHSEFDLVQVIPIPVPSDSFEDEGEGLATGDMNFDGLVGDSDLDMFARAWLNEKAVADLNMDAVVDDFDLEAFIESYHQQP